MTLVKLEFQPRDLWMGVYWETRRNAPYDTYWRRHVWVCIIPMFPIHFSWQAPWDYEYKQRKKVKDIDDFGTRSGRFKADHPNQSAMPSKIKTPEDKV